MTSGPGLTFFARGSGYSRPVIVFNNDPTNYTAITNSATALSLLGRRPVPPKSVMTHARRAVLPDGYARAKNIRVREGWNLQLIFQAFQSHEREMFLATRISIWKNGSPRMVS